MTEHVVAVPSKEDIKKIQRFAEEGADYAERCAIDAVEVRDNAYLDSDLLAGVSDGLLLNLEPMKGRDMIEAANKDLLSSARKYKGLNHEWVKRRQTTYISGISLASQFVTGEVLFEGVFELPHSRLELVMENDGVTVRPLGLNEEKANGGIT